MSGTFFVCSNGWPSLCNKCHSPHQLMAKRESIFTEKVAQEFQKDFEENMMPAQAYNTYEVTLLQNVAFAVESELEAQCYKQWKHGSQFWHARMLMVMTSCHCFHLVFTRHVKKELQPKELLFKAVLILRLCSITP